jgi:hypothetical protein
MRNFARVRRQDIRPVTQFCVSRNLREFATFTRLAAELTQAAPCINISETHTNRCSSGGIRNQQVVDSIPTAGSTDCFAVPAVGCPVKDTVRNWTLSV